MNCRQCREILDDLLVEHPDETTEAELHAHLEVCGECARDYDAAQQALAFLTPTKDNRVSPDLKESIMNAISDTTFEDVRPIPDRSLNGKILRWGLAVATAAAILIAVAYLLSPPPGPDIQPGSGISPLQIFAAACSAEELVFTGDHVIHLENEITVCPTDDPNWVKSQWLPITSLDSTGKMRFHQLRLPAEVGEGYSVKDESWYDPKSGRFARVLTADDKPLFANGYDGEAIYWLECAENADPKVVRHQVSDDFKTPDSPAEYLGITAGIHTSLDTKKNQFLSDAGEVTLEDGTTAHVLKTSFEMPDAGNLQHKPYWLFTIREDDKTIVKKEFFAGDELLLLVKRVLHESVEKPGIPWDLTGLEERAKDSQSKSPIKILPDMVRMAVTVEDMIEKADFETYVFSKDPAWAGPRQITDILDVVSPPKRMFAITYKADDGRHVVLVQAPSYNRMIGPMAQKMGKVVYTSPSGIKVLSTVRDKWLAGILLQSSQASIGPANSKDRTGYVLETPAGTYPALAVNGSITDEELHALVDSLVPAQDYVGNEAGNR